MNFLMQFFNLNMYNVESMKPNETMAHNKFITELLCNQN